MLLEEDKIEEGIFNVKLSWFRWLDVPILQSIYMFIEVIATAHCFNQSFRTYTDCGDQAKFSEPCWHSANRLIPVSIITVITAVYSCILSSITSITNPLTWEPLPGDWLLILLHCWLGCVQQHCPIMPRSEVMLQIYNFEDFPIYCLSMLECTHHYTLGIIPATLHRASSDPVDN